MSLLLSHVGSGGEGRGKTVIYSHMAENDNMSPNEQKHVEPNFPQLLPCQGKRQLLGWGKGRTWHTENVKRQAIPREAISTLQVYVLGVQMLPCRYRQAAWSISYTLSYFEPLNRAITESFNHVRCSSASLEGSQKAQNVNKCWQIYRDIINQPENSFCKCFFQLQDNIKAKTHSAFEFTVRIWEDKTGMGSWAVAKGMETALNIK